MLKDSGLDSSLVGLALDDEEVETVEAETTLKRGEFSLSLSFTPLLKSLWLIQDTDEAHPESFPSVPTLNLVVNR